MVTIETVSRSQIRWAVPDDERMAALLLLSHQVYAGYASGEIACVWGLVPPSLLSDRAYLWLWCNDLVEDHKFVFVRHSQLAVEKMLQEYETLVGFCVPDNKRAIKWIEWLGGEFKPEAFGRRDFEIRKR